MMDKETVLKIGELSSRCLDLVNCQLEAERGISEGMTDSDLDGAFMAVIMDAIRYGRKGASV
jgi:hypothetical protein